MHTLCRGRLTRRMKAARWVLLVAFASAAATADSAPATAAEADDDGNLIAPATAPKWGGNRGPDPLKVAASKSAHLAAPRAATSPPAAASADCPVELTGTPECADWAAEHAVKPPAHCEVTAFGNWAPCTRSCGGGDTWRARTVISNVLDQPCPALHDFMICENEPCGR